LYFPFATKDLQAVSLELQVETPSKIFTWIYPMVLLVEGKPGTAKDISDTFTTTAILLCEPSNMESISLEALSPL